MCYWNNFVANLPPQMGVLHYILYFLSAVGLVYFVYTIVKFPYRKIKSSVKYSLSKHKVTNRLMEDKSLRVTISAIIGFCINVAYVIFQGTIGNKSINLAHNYYNVLHSADCD